MHVTKELGAGWQNDIAIRDQGTILRQASTNPPARAIVGAKGAFLIDTEGKQILDLHGSNCHHVGYAHPRLISAVSEQMERLSFVPRGFTNDAVVSAGERLRRMWPYGEAKVCFVPGGAAAVELAMMVIRAHTGKYKTVSFYGSYHGRSAGALSVSGRTFDKPPRLGPLLPGALHVPAFYCKPEVLQSPADEEAAARLSFAMLEHTIREEGDVAAVIAEPIRNGPFTPPLWYWKQVREVCDKYDVLLVADEIPAGLGKTGRQFVTEHFDVRPDITLLGKALGGALVPVAAAIISDRLNTTSDLNLGYFTYERSPVMAKVADTVLQIIEEEGLVDRSREVGAYAKEAFEELAARSRSIKDIRAAGLMIGITLNEPLSSKECAFTRAVRRECLNRGMFIQHIQGPALSLSFPLIVDRDIVDQSVKLFEQSLQAAETT